MKKGYVLFSIVYLSVVVACSGAETFTVEGEVDDIRLYEAITHDEVSDETVLIIDESEDITEWVQIFETAEFVDALLDIRTPDYGVEFAGSSNEVLFLWIDEEADTQAMFVEEGTEGYYSIPVDETYILKEFF
ncbi:hypothetical protein [Alkalicoccobacillus porphyridii]|uniref:YhfM-like domain-containing protein n=1 Tax=Alkalicoccobacillus porphyridii TaxID=2597270 RepID=A0A553ZVT3_9BACI|nr:hypothetical protein [Alkalicoccobacillus porphyridii]TSB45542.1 hypothetical protein FN960_15340 [Alkalicoccobacillus porphyridii]